MRNGKTFFASYSTLLSVSKVTLSMIRSLPMLPSAVPYSNECRCSSVSVQAYSLRLQLPTTYKPIFSRSFGAFSQGSIARTPPFLSPITIRSSRKATSLHNRVQLAVATVVALTGIFPSNLQSNSIRYLNGSATNSLLRWWLAVMDEHFTESSMFAKSVIFMFS